MPEQPQRPPNIAALVASINRYHARAVRSEQEMHEWAIVSREIIAQSRELLVAVEHALRGAARRGARAVLSAEASPAAPSIGSQAPLKGPDSSRFFDFAAARPRAGDLPRG
jgi:hypothetical protein